jgi:hypothetical protein
MSSLFLFGRKQDIGFELPVNGVRGHRHHVRFWATTFEKRKSLSIRTIHWHDRQTLEESKDLLWVGAASRDIGFAFIRHNVQITHMIASNTNMERELIVKDLKAAGRSKSVRRVRLGKAYTLINRAWWGQLHTDGMMAIVNLKD